MEDRRPFVPQSIKNARAGTRPELAALLALVDTDQPAFPFVAAELRAMAEAGVELDPSSIAIAIKVGQRKHDVISRRNRTTPERAEIVYYIRRAELVKIGTTSNPVARMKSLMPDEILAFEPGGRDLEQRRHRQFAPERISRKGEYFRLSTRLRNHITEVRTVHGEPDDAWASVATLGRGYSLGREVVQLPEPVSGELLTSAEASKRFGMHFSTVSQWVRRGRIAAAGTNGKGRPVYHVEHLQFLIERGRRSTSK